MHIIEKCVEFFNRSCGLNVGLIVHKILSILLDLFESNRSRILGLNTFGKYEPLLCAKTKNIISDFMIR